jgi:hypothetical protein
MFTFKPLLVDIFRRPHDFGLESTFFFGMLKRKCFGKIIFLLENFLYINLLAAFHFLQQFRSARAVRKQLLSLQNSIGTDSLFLNHNIILESRHIDPIY